MHSHGITAVVYSSHLHCSHRSLWLSITVSFIYSILKLQLAIQALLVIFIVMFQWYGLTPVTLSLHVLIHSAFTDHDSRQTLNKTLSRLWLSHATQTDCSDTLKQIYTFLFHWTHCKMQYLIATAVSWDLYHPALKIRSTKKCSEAPGTLNMTTDAQQICTLQTLQTGSTNSTECVVRLWADSNGLYNYRSSKVEIYRIQVKWSSYSIPKSEINLFLCLISITIEANVMFVSSV